MNRRNFLALALSALVFAETAKAYIDPPGWHRHKCPKCGYIWTHTGNNVSHNCSQCGTYENVWYQGPLPPSNFTRPLAAQPVIIKAQPNVADASNYKF